MIPTERLRIGQEMKNASGPTDLKVSGLKATAPRLKILEIFQKHSAEPDSGRHMSAEDVYRALVAEHVDVGLATVYRVLTQFEQAGLLVRRHFEAGRAVFELNEGAPHHHLVCLTCGRGGGFVDPENEQPPKNVALDPGFELEGHAPALYRVGRA